MRYKDMKLLLGNPGKMDGWYPPPQVMEIGKDDYEIQQLIESKTESFKSFDFSMCEGTPVRLYNLTSDPTEKENIANQNPEVVNDLMQRLSKYFKSMIPIDVTPEIKEGNPNNF